MKPSHRFKTLSLRAAAVGAIALLAGCANLAPDYQRPALPVPATLDSSTPAPVSSTAETQTPALSWNDFLQEQRLREVVALTLENNRDLRVAVLAISKARAQYGVSRADLFPTLAANGEASNSNAGLQSSNSNTQPGVRRQYTAELGITSYEIDFFSRVRNLNDAALQQFFSITENRRSVQLSLVAEVVNAWLTLDADGRRLQLANNTLANLSRAYELSKRSFELGATSGLALAQAQTTVDAARIDVGSFTSLVARDRNLLALLIGAPMPVQWLPDGVIAAPNSDGTVPVRQALTASLLLAVPDNLPSSRLQNRPDVQAAEFALRSSYASIGAARAAFFPSITLTAAAGSSSSSLSNLFASGSSSWLFLPQIRLPIFDAGRNRANLDIAQIDRDSLLAEYEKAVQTAFRETADALAERATLASRLSAQRSLVAATEQVLALSEARYRLGSDSFLPVLDARRALYAAEQTRISLVLTEQLNRITLYKVLGGG